MKKVTFITGNQNKADYLVKLLNIKIAHQKIELDEIQAVSLEAVVEHKVRQAYDKVRTAVLVEDVSLEFNALNGLPGTFIKFFVDETGLATTCKMLDGFQDRSAVAKCGYGYFDGINFHYFEGSATGKIAVIPANGERGFGWDRIFIPHGYNGVALSDMSERQYEDLYIKIKPIEQVRNFLTSED